MEKPLTTPVPRRQPRKPRRFAAEAAAYSFLAPYLLVFVLFMMIPAVWGVYISFTKWDILGSPEWVGIANYRKIFSEPLFIKSIVNTFLFMILTVIPLVGLALGLALLLNMKLRGTALVRTVVFMPYVVTVSVVGILWAWLYDANVGLINYYLSLLGIGKIDWLGDRDTALLAIAIATVWWTINVNMIIYLAGLQDIPKELYEASQLDGASPSQQFRYVTLPLLAPVNAFVIPLTVIGAWRVFGQVVVMTRGGPEASTYVIAQYTYLTAFQNFEMGPASAAAVVLLLITLVFSLIQMRAFRIL